MDAKAFLSNGFSVHLRLQQQKVPRQDRRRQNLLLVRHRQIFPETEQALPWTWQPQRYDGLIKASSDGLRKTKIENSLTSLVLRAWPTLLRFTHVWTSLKTKALEKSYFGEIQFLTILHLQLLSCFQDKLSLKVLLNTVNIIMAITFSKNVCWSKLKCRMF